ncbi:MAG: hypothetical protein PUJ55_07205 [Clostridiales bacterium]|nr:hypothetical protein [Roseburia sp.]MDD7636708.1 hypothetical protein [Clostridiales bacterium]MDY4111689.1 hypothetical protein [Roseburia sp.]
MTITRAEIGNDKVYDAILDAVKKKSSGFGKFFKKEFSREEAGNVVNLKLSDMEITNFDFVRYLPNLEEIDFYEVTGISHITGLSYAPKLRWVTFYNTNVPDLEEIAGCRGLTYFAYDCGEGYEHCAKSEFSFLEQMHNLEGVCVEGSPLTDVTCFLQCTKLTEIALVHCPIQTIAPLKQLQYLTHLDLINCGLTELEDIEKFPSLQVVSVEENSLTEEQIAHYRSICKDVMIYG